MAESASKPQAMIWLVMKSEVLAAIWRLRCRLIEDEEAANGAESETEPEGAAAHAHTGAEVLRAWQVAMRARVMEERVRPTAGLSMADWLANRALAEDVAERGLVRFAPELGGVERRILEGEDPDAPDYLYAGLPIQF